MKKNYLADKKLDENSDLLVFKILECLSILDHMIYTTPLGGKGLQIIVLSSLNIAYKVLNGIVSVIQL